VLLLESAGPFARAIIWLEGEGADNSCTNSMLLQSLLQQTIKKRSQYISISKMLNINNIV